MEQEGLAGFRQSRPLHAAFQERHAQPIFQFRNLAPDRWLRRFQDARGGAERALFCSRKKGPNLVPVEGDRVPVHASTYSNCRFFDNRLFADAWR